MGRIGADLPLEEALPHHSAEGGRATGRVVLRRATSADAWAMADVFQESFARNVGVRVSTARLSARLAQAIEGGRVVAAVAEQGGSVVGYGSRTALPLSSGAYVLLALHVLPAWQGLGVGRSLLAVLRDGIPSGSTLLAEALGEASLRLLLGAGGEVVGEGILAVGGRRLRTLRICLDGTGMRDRSAAAGPGRSG